MDVKTKETLSLDTQLGDSQESSRSPSKKEVGTKKILNKDALTKNIKAQVPNWKTVKKQAQTQNYNETAQNQKMMFFYGIESTQ